MTLNDPNAVLKCSHQAGESKKEDGFQEVRRRKRYITEEEAHTSKKAAQPTTSLAQKNEVATRNFFAPIRTTTMDTDSPVSDSASAEVGGSEKAGRPPAIVLTSAANLIHLQRQIRGVAKQSFELCSTRYGTRVTTTDMVDYLAVRAYFDSNNLAYYTFHPKSMKPITAVIRHLPQNTPAETYPMGWLALV
jgi:hypothetical protein